MNSKLVQRKIFVALSSVVFLAQPSMAATPVAQPAPKPLPTGTMLMPMQPKLDTYEPDQPSPQPASKNSSTSSAQQQILDSENPTETAANQNELKPTPENVSAESGIDEDDSDLGLPVGAKLKGTIQLIADDTEFDQQTNTFLGTGNAIVLIGGEDSKLEADTILYDQNNQTIDARGAVRIYRNGQLTTGSAFKFKVNSDEYLITNPDTEIQGADIIARKSIGNSRNVAFSQGTLQMPQPFSFQRNAVFGPLGFIEETAEKHMHPDAYLPNKPSWKFKARRMVYERYKDVGNLTVLGGRVCFGNLSIPVGKITTTVGGTNQRLLMPITPQIGNNLQMGGISFGPSFNYGVGKSGMFKVIPMMQIGGRNSTSGTSQTGQIGAGARISYTGDRLNAQIAYGSVSNLVVGDLRYNFTRSTKFQMGVNRFIEDGIFGARRARYIAELVDLRGISKIPYLASVTFRTSGGWASDDPNLLNLTPEYKKLFNMPLGDKITKAMRFEEQINVSTLPLFAYGDNKLGVKLGFSAAAALRGYSTGDSMLMAQVGPVLNLYLKRLRLNTGYFQSGVKGQSPFVFDQFINGSQSTYVQGDIKLCKYLTVGTSIGYNLNAKLLTNRSISAAIGPEDMKFIVLYDTIRGINRYGFDILFGQPIPYNKLVLKNSPDQGQLGSGI